LRNEKTMGSKILESARAHVEQLFNNDLKKGFAYHSLERTLEVTEKAEQIAEQMSLTNAEQEALLLASLFHDAARSVSPKGELSTESAVLAREFLEEASYEPKQIDQVCEVIIQAGLQSGTTLIPARILKDAMLAYLSSEHYLRHLENLRWEERIYNNLQHDENNWLKLQRNRLMDEQFYTEAGKKLFGKQKKQIEKGLKKLQKVTKKKKDQSGPKSIGDSRPAQMMFKTALRNHIDLTNIADNKANIMLSINALIITISMPLLASNVQGNEYLLLPASSLMLTCMLSIIYATLATRPIKMTGYTDLSLQEEGKTNLFFFGNFFKMKITDYHEGIRQVIEDEEILESSILNDLYYLGAALGHKYRQLRVCYNIFMIGITFTVISFALSFTLLREGGI
jgi:hypothetical protein